MFKRKPQHILPEALFQAAAQGDALGMMQAAVVWLRQGGAAGAPVRFRMLCRHLQQDTAACQTVTNLLCRWLSSVRIYPTLITIGIFSRSGFGHEFRHRLYERLNPAYKDRHDLRDVLAMLFHGRHDAEWLAAIPLPCWLRLLALMRRHTDPAVSDTCGRHLRNESLYAVEMLSVWVAAEDLDPDLIRLEPKLLDVDSPFVGLMREVSDWLAHYRQTPFAGMKPELGEWFDHSAEHQPPAYDDSHLKVMMSQSRKLIDRLQRKGTGAGAGSSMHVAHLLERLKQTLNRMEQLMALFTARSYLQCMLRTLLLSRDIAVAVVAQRRIAPLWRGSVKMLARSISQNSSRHGEHYITRNRSEYWGMLRSAAGGGVLIALMALLKIHIGSLVQDHFWHAVLVSLNYGIGFVLIHMLHFTVATKQPAMTAASFAQAVERSSSGRAVSQKLAQLLIDVVRSQGVAVFGNVLVAVLLACLISWGFAHRFGAPLLDEATTAYQLKSMAVFTTPALLFAAIAGVWLFCSGIIAGFFDNRADYLNLKMRLREHPLLKRILPAAWRQKLADYIHNHYGAMMGNFCFGWLLGMTGYLGHLTGLPLDIRHVAFSSANLGYAAVSGHIGPFSFAANLLMVLMIGAVNLLVSFSITLWVALRSRDAVVDDPRQIVGSTVALVKQKPKSLFFPPPDAPEADAEKKPAAPGK
ncbi:recombinase [Eikenella longinqua]|uniref:Recombinase n=1 Tax=Eikenella longinqua TaxID=1795827 RepID=A0A1A9RZE5_9NEIS|nr:recombinase [Eikenella longinqua]OAM29964.1 recombinase [Eikenella longinqua]